MPALAADWTPEMRSMVELNRLVAARSVREGDAARGFAELIRATRSVPMRAPLASVIVRVALAANQATPAIAVIRQGLDETEGADRLGVMRALIRLFRRTKDAERAREMLVQLLAEQPGDRRARFVLNALLEADERWDELDASLEKEIRLAVRRGALRTASRLSLRRARLWGERLADPARAALRYGQAAQFAEQARDLDASFLLRLLQVHNLHRSHAPPTALDDAAGLTLALGERLGKAERATELFKQLGFGAYSPAGVEKPHGASIRPKLFSPAKANTETAIAPAPTRPAVRSADRLLLNSQAARTVEITAAGLNPSSTQRELLAVVDGLTSAAARAPEVAAVLAAAVDEGPDPLPAQKLEAHYTARGAWRELSEFYRRSAKRAQSKPEQVKWAEKLAEVLESELHDTTGAAEAWGLIVAATGDPRAVSEQVRLLNAKRDFSGVRQALNAGVERASDAPERAQALVLRAEEALSRQQVSAARNDFEKALELVPLHPQASAGLAEVSAMHGESAAVFAFERALAALPKRAAARAALYRRLAHLADAPLRDPKLSRTAWAEVAAELPGDEEAIGRLTALARSSGDDDLLESQVRAVLRADPMGDRARPARMELIAILERTGRADAAIGVLREFVKLEPAHQEAWVALADRLIAKGLDDDGALALEEAAAATEGPAERLAIYQRLARLVRERLYDDERADGFDARAEALKPAAGVPVLPLGGPVLLPKPRARASAPAPIAAPPSPPVKAPARENDFEEVAAVLESRLEPDEDARVKVQVRHPARLVPLLKSFVGESDFREFAFGHDAQAHARALAENELHDDEEEVLEVHTNDFALPEDDDYGEDGSSDETATEAVLPKPLEARRQTLEIPTHVGEDSASFGTAAQSLRDEQIALEAQVAEDPLEPESYRALAEHYDTASDPNRSSLMLEIARALDGDPNAAPRTPRLILSEADRLALKHPLLRTDAGELVSLVATALCRLFPAKGRNAGSSEEFRLDGGKGAKVTADALLAGVRILGVRAPDVHLSEAAGPPFSVVFADGPRLLVGRLAVKKPSPDAELRFYAGRALFTLSPDLLALRSVSRDEMTRGLQIIGQVLQGKASAVHSRLVVNDLSPQVWARLKVLFHTQLRVLELGPLTDGARHSANRAGLVVCGGVAPAIEALRAKKALTSEMIELVRFAASDAYLEMRGRTLGRR